MLRSPLEPWRTWLAANGLDWPGTDGGSQFNDIGLMCDGAAAGMGVALVRLKLGAPGWNTAPWCVWAPARLLPRAAQPRPLPVLAHRRHGPLGCTAFAEWLKTAVG